MITLYSNYLSDKKYGKKIMEEYLSLQIGAIFLILFVSAVGVITPQLIRLVNLDTSIAEIENSLLFRSLKTFSGGLVLSVAFVHLLTDSVIDLTSDEFVSSTNGFPCKYSATFIAEIKY